MSFSLLGAPQLGDDLDWLLPDADAAALLDGEGLLPFDNSWLLSLGSGSGSDSGATGVPPTPLLRCLDPLHPPTCTRCTPAPPAGSEDDFELVGDPGKKNGEKRLRKLMARTAEWNGSASRATLATALEASAAAHDSDTDAERLQRVAEIVRAKHSGSLSKRDLLLLARAWHYASDVWFYHGRSSRRTQAFAQQRRGEAPKPSPAAVAECHLVGGDPIALPATSTFSLLTPEAACERVSSVLSPLVAQTVEHLAGTQAMAVYKAHSAAPSQSEVTLVRCTLEAMRLRAKLAAEYPLDASVGDSIDLLSCYYNEMHRHAVTTLPEFVVAADETGAPAALEVQRSLVSAILSSCELALRMQMLLVDARLASRAELFSAVETKVWSMHAAFLTQAVEALQRRLAWSEGMTRTPALAAPKDTLSLWLLTSLTRCTDMNKCPMRRTIKAFLDLNLM